MLKVRIELNAPSAAKCVHLYIITAFLNVVAVFILVFKCLTENNLIDRTVLIVIVSNVMGSRQFVLNKSLTLKVLTHAHKLGHLGCTLCHQICDMSGFSLLKRPFISHSRAQTVESHLSSWNPAGHFWISESFCECSDAGNVTVSISHQTMFPPAPRDL